MKLGKRLPMPIGLIVLLSSPAVFADNPLILHQFTADPTARVFNGKIFLFPSHDIPAAPGKGRAGWFVMEDYHVFSSENLMDWTDHGVILAQDKTDWTNPTAYSMWAPDCVEHNGKYYFYFPAPAKPGVVPGGRGGNRIGVAIADRPQGPYVPQPMPIEGIGGIDPCVLIDKDGQAYLYVAGGRISVAKLKDNMIELAPAEPGATAPAPITEPTTTAATEPATEAATQPATRPFARGPIDPRVHVIPNLPTQGLIEGPFVFERNGIYYLTYPHAVTPKGGKEAEQLEYAMGKGPMGPFTVTGVIMDQTPSGCWTNHHSIVQYNDQWYLFYHDKDLSPGFDKNRSVHADYLFFNPDGTIQKVIPTLRGVGFAPARNKIQIDRYSAVSKQGTSLAFLDDADRQQGWKITLSQRKAWVRYNRVDFGDSTFGSVRVRALSSTGGSIEIRLDRTDGPLLAQVRIPKGPPWSIITSKLAKVPSSVHDLVVVLPHNNNVDLDWVTFE